MTKRAGSGSAMHALLDLELGEESSSDSDFRIEDHDNGDDDCSDFTDDDDEDGDDDDDDDDDEDGENTNRGSGEDEDGDGGHLNGGGGGDAGRSKTNGTLNGPSPPDVSAAAHQSTVNNAAAAKHLLQQARAKEALERANAKLMATPICCACLGDRSDDTNEIVECDNCGISVHEGCYGIGDSASVSSTVSSCSTEPWFCEACKANVAQPVCELCPNRGGIFKETDVGKWVHLVCALYVPGVAFGEVDLLSSVTLFEMPYSKWGAKSCSLCDDVRFARTGVCIGCDAGMCKTYFHVTCAQAAGLLSEAHSEEADHADPFYAHCKVHSDKALIKKRKRNYNGLRLKMEFRSTEAGQKKADTASEAQLRIERKLKKHRKKYVQLKGSKQEPWVPTQKMPRLLSTSASACRKLMLKAELMDIDTAAIEFQEAQMAALADVRKKWHIPPAFSVEFIGYYLDRIARLRDIKTSLQQQTSLNQKLVDQQQQLRTAYDDQIREQAAHAERNASLRDSIGKLHAAIHALVPHKQLPSVELIGRPAVVVVEEASPVRIASPAAVAKPLAPPPAPPARPMSVPTAAALKMGVGFPLTNLPGTHEDPNRILSTQCQKIRTHTSGGSSASATKLMHECGICAQRTDQHMLAKCDTCQLHYHLGCLHPPLQRHPKKSKLYGWQCSECVKSDDSDAPLNLPTGPRKSRTKYGKDGTIVPVDPPSASLLHLLDDSLTTTTPESSVNVSAASDDAAPAARQKHKGPGRPRNTTAAKRPAAVAASSSHDCQSTDEARSTTSNTGSAAKRKKGKKSVTVASDEAADVVVGVPSLGSPPVADAHDDSRQRADQAMAAKAPLAMAEAPQQQQPAQQQPLVITIANGGSEEAVMLAPLVNGDANGTTTADVDIAAQHAGAKPKSAKKLKKEKQHQAAVAAAAAASVVVPKPSYYIDQNGVLTSLPAAANHNAVATPPPTTTPAQPIECDPLVTNGAPTTATTNGDDTASAVIDPNDNDTATIHNSVAMTEHELLLLHKQNRKRRKELRQRIRADEASAAGEPLAERSPNKEHKKKRKRRNHDLEDPSVCANDGIPRIKIKFKALSLPGEPAAESHCFYVSADMVRPADDDYGDTGDSPVPRSYNKHPPSSTASLSAPTPPTEVLGGTTSSNHHSTASPAPKPAAPKTPKTAVHKPPPPPPATVDVPSAPTPPPVATTPRPVGRPPKPVPHRRLSVFNPKKFTAAVNKALKKNTNPMTSGPVAKSAATKAATKATTVDGGSSNSAAAAAPPSTVSSPAITSMLPTSAPAPAATKAAAASRSAHSCDVCLGAGTTQDVVRCDECKKNYHFRCLEPPVKKTPKRRGYSWHCADCDPTDVEST